MECIIIEVDEGAKKAYNNLSLNNKNQLQLAVNFWLKKRGNEEDFANYENLLDIMRNEAEKNGLTLDVFQGIMELGDQTIKNLFGDGFQSHQ